MKKLDYFNLLVFAVVFFTLFCFTGNLSAQELEDPEVDIPFIDRDGDGINDLLQSEWGLRVMERYRMRRGVWEQLSAEIIQTEDGFMVDTDGDGIGDTPFREFMKGKMDELIDVDGDGIPDTPLRDYLGRRFSFADFDGDGIPDDISQEELQQRMREMREWREEIHQRLMEGLPPFVDEDGDGIPDNLPEGFGGRRFGRTGGE